MDAVGSQHDPDRLVGVRNRHRAAIAGKQTGTKHLLVLGYERVERLGQET